MHAMKAMGECRYSSTLH